MIQSIPVAVDLAVRILPWPLIVSLADRRALLFRRFSDCFPVPFSCVRLPGNLGSFVIPSVPKNKVPMTDSVARIEGRRYSSAVFFARRRAPRPCLEAMDLSAEV
jgi:hypothetical protein